MFLHWRNLGVNWRVLMSWESKPDVISTPIQHKKRKKYIFLMLGFLYHGVLSSAAKLVRTGSAVPSGSLLKKPMIVEVSTMRTWEDHTCEDACITRRTTSWRTELTLGCNRIYVLCPRKHQGMQSDILRDMFDMANPSWFAVPAKCCCFLVTWSAASYIHIREYIPISNGPFSRDIT